MEEERGGGVYVTVCKKISNKRGLCSLGEAIAPGRNKSDASKKEGYNRVKFWQKGVWDQCRVCVPNSRVGRMLSRKYDPNVIDGVTMCIMLRFLIVLQIICDAAKYLLRCKISAMLQNICYAAKNLQFADI